ncbi:MAG TPA: nucleotide kinase domain-containing protein [Myxococcota bacterium]|nr:nucleotide kinase domain-containing protein [Myxococcota bacterium]
MTPTFDPAALDRFVYWMTERHSIYLRRAAGEPWPWTRDEILAWYRFTNVYRELDRTTVWFRESYRGCYRDDPSVFLGTVIFRWFNRVETGERLIAEPNLLLDWDAAEAELRLRPHAPWVTGAFIVHTPKNAGIDKLTGLLGYIQPVWDARATWEAWFKYSQRSIQATVGKLAELDGLGGFMAYEIASDLVHTALLEKAPDIDTWANPGPGAMRGLNRLSGRALTARLPERAAVAEMRSLLAYVRERWPADWPALHLREIEHSLCEFDKYDRARLGQGRPRGVFTPRP